MTQGEPMLTMKQIMALYPKAQRYAQFAEKHLYAIVHILHPIGTKNWITRATVGVKTVKKPLAASIK